MGQRQMKVELTEAAAAASAKVMAENAGGARDSLSNDLQKPESCRDRLVILSLNLGRRLLNDPRSPRRWRSSPPITADIVRERIMLARRGKGHALLNTHKHLSTLAISKAWRILFRACRRRERQGRPMAKAIGHADDKQRADGAAVLNYEQAANKALALARGDANAAADKPVSISEAIDAYEEDLRGRGRRTYNAQWARLYLPEHLKAQTLANVTPQQLRNWRDGLNRRGELEPASINRLAKCVRAAFALAEKLDKRVAANRQAWHVGFEMLDGAVKSLRRGSERCASNGRRRGGVLHIRGVRLVRSGARPMRFAFVAIGALHRCGP